MQSRRWKSRVAACAAVLVTPLFMGSVPIPNPFDMRVLAVHNQERETMGLEPLSWNDGLALAVVPGVTPNPSAPPIFFGSITAATLLLTGGGNLPLSIPGVHNQLWNNGGLICVDLTP